VGPQLGDSKGLEPPEGLFSSMFGSRCWLSADSLTGAVGWSIYAWPFQVAWTSSQNKE